MKIKFLNLSKFITYEFHTNIQIICIDINYDTLI